jgi:hypothetical protein
MKHEDIIKLARQVGYPLVEYDGTPYIPPLLAVLLESIADAERKACAKLCEEHQFASIGLAAAIRARGNT